MKFLFKNRDFAQSALSLAAGMLLVTIVTAWRTKGDLGITGLTLGLPLGVLLFWLIYSLKMHLGRTSLEIRSLMARPSAPRAYQGSSSKRSMDAVDESFADTEHSMPGSLTLHQDQRSRRLLGRDTQAWKENRGKSHDSIDQWHR